jgi:hypothetical protein
MTWWKGGGKPWNGVGDRSDGQLAETGSFGANKMILLISENGQKRSRGYAVIGELLDFWV